MDPGPESNPIHTLTFCLFKIHFTIILPSLSWSPSSFFSLLHMVVETDSVSEMLHLDQLMIMDSDQYNSHCYLYTVLSRMFRIIASHVFDCEICG